MSFANSVRPDTIVFAMPLSEFLNKNPEGLVARAYRFARHAHEGQKRKNGEPYFNHPLAAAELLKSWQLDETTIAAGLLHDTIEDTSITKELIEKEFGKDVAFLVDGVSKLGHIKYRGAKEQVENLRKFIFALSEDLRVIFIKLADRLHNMRTLAALPPAKQKRIAIETDEIYAPLAYRLGMSNVSGELQDLAFPYIYPKETAWLKKTVSEEYETRTEYLRRVKPLVEEALAKHGITSETIDFRAKRYSSLYKKLLKHEMNIEKIYDLVAMRVIVETTEQCYGALGAIHETWAPLPGRIKDFIARPKLNGYRSLHTTVVGPEKKIVEFQIRTREMHAENEHGMAAHWLYKQQHKTKDLVKELAWVEQLKNWQEAYDPEANPDEYLNSLKINFFKDRVMVTTPKGDVINLPAGATPVDFAYEIHGDVGNSAVAAKVNNSFVPLNHELNSGDCVEILTQKNKRPSEDWLTFVKTSKARDHIKTTLKEKRKVREIRR